VICGRPDPVICVWKAGRPTEAEAGSRSNALRRRTRLRVAKRCRRPNVRSSFAFTRHRAPGLPGMAAPGAFPDRWNRPDGQW